MEYEGVELRAYLDVIRRWLWLIALGAFLAGAAALTVSFLTPPTYQAEAAVAVMRSKAEISFEPRFKTVSEAELARNLMNIQDRLKALKALVKNTAIASQVIEELGPMLSPEERRAETLLKMVETKMDGDLIKIVVEADSSEKAAAIANAWARAYEEYVNRLYGENSPTPEDLQSQVDEARQSYQEAEEALSKFLGNNQIDALSREIASKKNTLADYYAAKRELDRLIADAKALRDQLREGTTSSTMRDSLSLLLIKANASTLSSGQPADLQFSFGQLGGFAEDPAQQLSELETLIANLEARRDEVQNLIDDPLLQREILRLEEQLERERARQRQLTSARDLAWETYQTLANKAAEVEVASQVKETEVRFAMPAVKPEKPIKPRKKLNTLLASVVGGMLAVGVAFLIEYLDDTIGTPEDVRRTLGLSTLSSIAPLPAGVESGLVTISQPRAPSSEGFRALRTQLQIATDKPLKALLVTSPNPLEGKSTIVANLGVVMAQAGWSTVLVDSDMRRPVLHDMFGLSNAEGLSTVLSGDGRDPAEYLQATKVENLRLLASGPLPPNPSELLSSPRIEEVIQQLKGEADVLLLDSPAALAVTDAALLAKRVDGVLLVVESGVTQRGSAQQALEGLTKVGTNLVGVVLNRFSPGAAAEYYYYGGDQAQRRRKADIIRQPFRRLLDNVIRRTGQR